MVEVLALTMVEAVLVCQMDAAVDSAGFADTVEIHKIDAVALD